MSVVYVFRYKVIFIFTYLHPSFTNRKSVTTIIIYFFNDVCSALDGTQVKKAIVVDRNFAKGFGED